MEIIQTKQTNTIPVLTPNYLTYEGMVQYAEMLLRSGTLPTRIKTVEGAFAVMKMGLELGLDFMTAFCNIYVIDRIPCLSSLLIGALLRRGGVKWKTIRDAEQVKGEDKKVLDLVTTIRFYRDDIEEDFTFTFQDAVKADLILKDNWKKYTKPMLWWRTLALGGKRVAPDLLLGYSSVEEIADVKGYKYEINPETGAVLNVEEPTIK